ncbi:MAG: penicillin-binding protein [Candidatus Melainabacteria bacterium]|nr:MAG: penicillin-binding protein [Candidatus Melainabacteria bacterium]
MGENNGVKRSFIGGQSFVRAGVLAAISALTALVLLVFSVNASVKSLSLPSQDSGLQIYDRNDKLVLTVFADRDSFPVPLGQIAKSMQQAIVTSEDRDFYQHHGVNLLSIARAVSVNLSKGHAVQGGSTITQQLVKNLFFPTQKRSLYGKVQEAILAIELEMLYPKKKILEAYLNYIYFGRGAFGVERAAEKYFGKTSSTLTPAESAYLAGLVTAPSTLSEPAHYGEALKRQKDILTNMAALHYISPELAAKARYENLKFRDTGTTRDSMWYYISYVLQVLESQFGHEKIHAAGTKVFTNLDIRAQEEAEKALTLGIRRAPRGISQGALVCLSVKDAAVISLIGGTGSYQLNPWDRALNCHTAGSAFKPFVYLAGLLSGAITPDTVVDDMPLSIRIPGTEGVYTPKNFDGTFLGPISVRRALALSRNVCAVRLAEATGIGQIINTARLAGISSPLAPTPAIALGTGAVSPLEMASAYATFARRGVRAEPILIRRIENKDGQILGVCKLNEQPVFDAEPVDQLVDIMQDVVKVGTGKAAQLPDRPVAGKTGTADGGKDVWFVGFTPDTVTAVWGGNDEHKAVPGTQVTGGAIAAGIWKNYMQAYYRLHPQPPAAFPVPVNPLLHDYELNLPSPQLAASPEEGATSPAREEGSPSKSGFVGRLFHKIFGIFR